MQFSSLMIQQDDCILLSGKKVIGHCLQYVILVFSMEREWMSAFVYIFLIWKHFSAGEVHWSWTVAGSSGSVLLDFNIDFLGWCATKNTLMCMDSFVHGNENNTSMIVFMWRLDKIKLFDKIRTASKSTSYCLISHYSNANRL